MSNLVRISHGFYHHSPLPICPLTFYPISPLLCFSFLTQPVASGFWGKAEVAFEEGGSQVCLGPQSWMNVFVVRRSPTSSYPTPPRRPLASLSILHLPPTSSHQHTHALAGAHFVQMTPLIMYLRYLAPVKQLRGVSGGRRLERGRCIGPMVWSMVSWLSLRPSVECKHWIRAGKVYSSNR